MSLPTLKEIAGYEEQLPCLENMTDAEIKIKCYEFASKEMTGKLYTVVEILDEAKKIYEWVSK